MAEYQIKHFLEIEHEAATKIVLSILKDDLINLYEDWNRVFNKDHGYVFSKDRDEDLKQISEHISAYNKILAYYGEK